MSSHFFVLPQNRLRIVLFMLFIAVSVTGFVLYGRPTLPDGPFRWIGVLGSFLIFVSWVAATLGWGSLWAKILRWPVLESSTWTRLSSKGLGWAALGSVWASASIYIINLGAGMGPRLKPVAIVWTVVGLGLLPLSRRVAKAKDSKRAWTTDRVLATLLLTFLGLSVAIRLIEGVELRGHGDAFICYLSGPRAWFDAGSLTASYRDISYFFAASWEALFQWGNLLLAREPGTGLDSVQRFAQWLSAFFGQAGVAAAVAVLFASLSTSPRGRVAALIAAVAAVSAPDFRGAANLAKNEAGACFWLLAAAVPLWTWLRDSKSTKRPLLASGLLFGAGFMAKFPYATFLLGQVLFWMVILGKLVWNSRRKLATILTPTLVLAAGGLIGASWIIARNIAIAKNPLFPFFSSVFPSPLLSELHSQTLAAATSGAAALSWHAFGQYLGELIRYQWPIAASLLVGLVAIPTLRANTKVDVQHTRAAAIIAGAWFSAIAFTIAFRSTTEIRYQGPTVILLAASGAWVLAIATSFLPAFSKPATVVLALAVLGTSQMSFFTLAQIGEKKFKPTPAAILDHAGGRAKAWIRAHTAPHEKVLALGDNQTYYALYTGLVEIEYDGPLQNKLSRTRNDRELLNAILDSSYRYLYEYRPFSGDESLRARLSELTKRFSGCAVYSDTDSIIVDLTCTKMQL